MDAQAALSQKAREKRKILIPLSLNTRLPYFLLMSMSIRICSKRDKKYLGDKCIAGGIVGKSIRTGEDIIVLFMSNEVEDQTGCVIQLLSHEYLHYILTKVIDDETSMKLDNINHPFYVWDVKSRKWNYSIEFVHKKPSGGFEIL